MKAYLIAISSLALAGALWAQDAPGGGDIAQDAAQLARDAADKAGEAARSAAQATKEGAAVAAEKAGDAVEAAGQALEQLSQEVQKAQPGDAVAEATGDTQAVITATETATEIVKVVPPDVKAPAITAEKPGILGSWIVKRRIWTTNDSNVTPWTEGTLAERPLSWADIAKIDDVVLDENGQVVGYLADIGGFLGIGVKKVLLGIEAIHPVNVNGDWIFVTNFTKSELEALPNFDASTVLK